MSKGQRLWIKVFVSFIFGAVGGGIMHDRHATGVEIVYAVLMQSMVLTMFVDWLFEERV